MFCPTCGKEIPDDSSLCPACGAKITSGKREHNPNSRSRIILSVAIILVLLAASFGVYQVVKPRASKGQAVATLIPYRKVDKWGFCDQNKKLVIADTYDDAYSFYEGFAPVEVNGKWGLIDTKGALVIPAVYDNVIDFTDGLASVKLNGKWGYINTKGTQYWEN